MKNGLFITVEGIEGSGKSTQISMLEERLEKQGYPYLVTREPGGSSIGELIRNILLDNKHREMSPKTELLLYLASRAQLISEVIGPALGNGKIVITDRYVDATLAYQGFGRGESLEQIRTFQKYLSGPLEPHLTFLLDMDPALGISRIGKRGKMNRLDRENMEFHQRVRAGYLTLAKENPKRIHLIAGENHPEAIHEEIMKILVPHLKPYTRKNSSV